MTTPRFTPDELAAATGGRWAGAPPAAVEGVSTDTRRIAAGNLFVALRGERFDAHAFLAEAAGAGAAAAVVAEGAAPPPSAPSPGCTGAASASRSWASPARTARRRRAR